MTARADVSGEAVVFVPQIVVTKIDKCGRGALLTNLLSLQEVVAERTSSCFPQPILVR